MVRHKLQQSRLNRTSIKQNNRQALYFIIASIAILFFLIQFGPFLINIFGNFIYSIRGDRNEDSQVVGKEILQPPSLYNIPNATQSAYINFNGTAPSGEGTVEIYVNDELEDEVDLDESMQFDVKRLPLKSGENTIRARLVNKNITSAFTEDYTVSYVKEKPKLQVSSPANGASFTRADRKINVSGQTNSDNIVMVNGFRAIVDSNGNFSYLLELKDGENTILIIAENEAGLTEQSELKVTYQP